MITFKASYINSSTILENKPDGTSVPKKVAFVEMHHNDISDLENLSETNRIWKSLDSFSFSKEILKSFRTEKRNNTDYPNNFFALTTQNSGFDELDPKQILALCQIHKNSEYSQFVEYLQVAPNTYQRLETRPFKHVGTAMLNSLKEMYIDKSIILESVIEAIPFYLANGFKSSVYEPCIMKWDASGEDLYSHCKKKLLGFIKNLVDKKVVK